jgi:DNA-binding LacI/PurR family transcriptional regulator
MNDLLAADIYFHTNNLEIGIPKDLSVVGYDDLQFADKMRTPLTTIHQPLYEMGRESFKLFLERLQKTDERYRKVILQNRLIIRKSVKKLN